MEKVQGLKTRNYDYEKQQPVETIDIINFISLESWSIIIVGCILKTNA